MTAMMLLAEVPWLTVLVLVTLIALCWSGGIGIYWAVPGRGMFIGGLLGVLGLILFIVLVMIFVGSAGPPTMR